MVKEEMKNMRKRQKKESNNEGEDARKKEEGLVFEEALNIPLTKRRRERCNERK